MYNNACRPLDSTTVTPAEFVEVSLGKDAERYKKNGSCFLRLTNNVNQAKGVDLMHLNSMGWRQCPKG